MIIKPYGDTMDDGAIQLSFTLPIADSARAREAARQLVLKLGFVHCEIAHTAPLSAGFTMFVAYGWTQEGIDPDTVEVEEDAVPEVMNADQVNKFIKEKIGRKIVIVGACTGSDAHTVGIDAIMNMKGYNHHFGLERYPMVDAHNMGAQVENEKLVAYCERVKADAVLVSQVVTQKDVHIQNMKEFVDLLESKGVRDKFILIVGGPHITHSFAVEHGFDAGFGRGTYAEHVATFVAKTLEGRLGAHA
jgi:beta-lysine 5,6-aminomutase beta subunit